MVEIYKRGAFIEACYAAALVIFFNETIEYYNDITNEELARFFKKIIRIIDKILYALIYTPINTNMRTLYKRSEFEILTI